VFGGRRLGARRDFGGKSSLCFSLSLWLLLLACCSLASPLALLLLSCSLRLRQLTHSPPPLAPGQISLLSRSSRLHLALLQPSSPCSSCSLLYACRCCSVSLVGLDRLHIGTTEAPSALAASLPRSLFSRLPRAHTHICRCRPSLCHAILSPG